VNHLPLMSVPMPMQPEPDEYRAIYLKETIMDNTRYIHPPATTTMNPPRQVSATSSALTMGGFGMIVGAAGSAAANIRRLNNNEIERGQAMKNVVRDSVGAGVATAAATAVAGALRLGGLFNVAGLLTVATATKYLYDTAFEPQAVPAVALPEPDEKTAAPAAKKTAKPASKAKARSTAKAKTAEKKED
jgi:hypothetical protein